MVGINVPQLDEAQPTSTPVCRLKLIGHMEAWAANGESVLPIGRKTRALLAIVALSAPRPVLRSRVADMLWSRRHEEQARASLRQELHRLLEALQPIGLKILDVTRDHIVLRPGLVWIDVQEVLRATTTNSSALALLEGDLLEEFDDVDPVLDQWIASERERLRDQARAVAEAVLGEQGEARLSIAAAQRLLSIDRSHEGAWRALMQGYAARGERSKAIQAYEQCRDVLTDVLNAAPLPDTQRLAAEIRAGHIPVPYDPVAEQPIAGARRRDAARVGALAPAVISAGSGEAEFSLGLAEEMTIALTRFGGLLVVSSASLTQFGNRNEAALRAAFDLDFLVNGSVQKAGTRLRITLRLLDLRDSSQVVWTYRSDRQMGDMLAIQDEVAAEVASQVELEIMRTEGRRAAQHVPPGYTAYERVTSALPLIARLQRDSFRQAGDMLDAALRLEPDDAPSHAWKAWWHLLGIGQGWTGQGHGVAEAVGHAGRALSLDPQNARALTIAGHVRTVLQRRPLEAAELHARALSLNPSLAMAWALSAVTQNYLGEPARAAASLAHYKRLSPTDPNAFAFDTHMGLAELLQRNVEAAVVLGRRASELSPGFVEGLKHYLAALGHFQGADESDMVLAKILAADPRFSVQSCLVSAPFVRPADRAYYAAGLRLAGAPEGRLITEDA